MDLSAERDSGRLWFLWKRLQSVFFLWKCIKISGYEFHPHVTSYSKSLIFVAKIVYPLSLRVSYFVYQTLSLGIISPLFTHKTELCSMCTFFFDKRKFIPFDKGKCIMSIIWNANYRFRLFDSKSCFHISTLLSIS